jgi:beta-galactosidase
MSADGTLQAEAGSGKPGLPIRADSANLIVQVQTPSNCDTVQLFVNGTSYGALRPADFLNLTPVWNVLFVPGVVAALGITNGQVVASAALQTASAPASVLLVPEAAILSAGRLDIGIIDVLLVDGRGIVVPKDDRVVTLSVTGPGSLIGFENGDTRGANPFRTNSQSTNFGRAMALIRTNGTPGTVNVTATSAGLPDATVSLQFV